ncbi:hypothetical protein [Saccharopolyspora sp. ASAGF58]|uniref:hypothetical protein n=1 Tax=Saccharopolyspora sp. ASAGF58 TaxID=2719023 RepID=UPI0014402BA1|nr:hypothetical protein [Saccharopolyspora sp. ASAGF58]QIZ36354.1 hypothetical protein FDZ84_18825 [Saccharopolyspora sp. ASAGF58]
MGEHTLNEPAGNAGQSWKPQTKVAASGIGGALAIIVVWLIASLGVEMPEAVATAIGALITTGVGYLTPQR